MPSASVLLKEQVPHCIGVGPFERDEAVLLVLLKEALASEMSYNVPLKVPRVKAAERAPVCSIAGGSCAGGSWAGGVGVVCAACAIAGGSGAGGSCAGGSCAGGSCAGGSYARGVGVVWGWVVVLRPVTAVLERA